MEERFLMAIYIDLEIFQVTYYFAALTPNF